MNSTYGFDWSVYILCSNCSTMHGDVLILCTRKISNYNQHAVYNGIVLMYLHSLDWGKISNTHDYVVLVNCKIKIFSSSVQI